MNIELTLEQLEKNVVDAEAAAAAALISVCAADGVVYAARKAAAAADLASEAKFVDYDNARLELSNYLKEQDNE